MSEEQTNPEVEETQSPEVKEEKPKKANKSKKDKMVVLVPNSTFGYGKRSYRAGERYVMAQKEVPTAMEKKFSTMSVEEAEKQDKAEAKAKARKVPVVGKK